MSMAPASLLATRWVPPEAAFWQRYCAKWHDGRFASGLRRCALAEARASPRFSNTSHEIFGLGDQVRCRREKSCSVDLGTGNLPRVIGPFLRRLKTFRDLWAPVTPGKLPFPQLLCAFAGHQRRPRKIT